MGRDLLGARFPFPFVVFVTRTALRVIFGEAVDFASVRSGSSYFPCDAEKVEADLQETLKATRDVHGGDVAPAVRRLEEGLANARMLAEAHPMPELTARLYERLGLLAMKSNEAARAQVQFERMREWAQQQRLDQWVGRATRGIKDAERQRTRSSPASTWPKAFRGAAPYTEQEAFHGREEDCDQVLEMLLRSDFRIGLLWGETGCGKTSLVRAGLIPRLKLQDHLPVFVNSYAEHEAGLAAALIRAAGCAGTPLHLAAAIQQAQGPDDRTIVVFCDQFEQVFVDQSPEGRQIRESLLRSLAGCAGPRSQCALSAVVPGRPAPRRDRV